MISQISAYITKVALTLACLALSGCIQNESQTFTVQFKKTASIVPQDIFTSLRGSVSPDGSTFVYSVFRTDDWSLRLMNYNLKTGEEKLLTSTIRFARSPDWSPDGKRIVYAESNEERKGLWIVDPKTGSEVKFLTDSISEKAFAPSWSKNNMIVFSCRNEQGSSLWMVRPDGSDLRQVANLQGESPALSDDGNHVAYFNGEAGNQSLRLYSFDTKKDIVLLQNLLTLGDHPVWDSKGNVFFVAAIGENPELHAWQISMHDKKVRQIDSLDHEVIRISRLNKDRLALVSSQPDVKVGTLPLLSQQQDVDASGFINVVENDTQALLPSWLPDGKGLVFTSGPWRYSDMMIRRNLKWDIGKIVFGKNPPQIIIAEDNEDYGPQYSPDGKWLALHAHLNNTDDIYVIPSSLETGLIRLTPGGIYETGEPDWSFDGEHLVYSAYKKGATHSSAFIIDFDPYSSPYVQELREVNLTGFEGSLFSPRFSPNGQQLAFTGVMTDGTCGVYTVSVNGGSPFCVSKYKSGQGYSGPEWSKDGNTLYFSSNYEGDIFQLMKIPSVGGEAVIVYAGDRSVLHPRLSPDGKQMAVTIWNNKTHIWLQEN